MFSFDPLDVISGYLSSLAGPLVLPCILGLIGLLWLVKTHYKKILKCLYDDDSLNISSSHMVHNTLFCRWCCTGEWTRELSWCCGRSRENAVQSLAEHAGVVPQPVRIQNMVIGDIPPDAAGVWSWMAPSKRDLYVSFEGNDLIDNMATDVVQDAADLSAVQFTSALTINVRDSWSEQHVRLSLRKSEVLGYTEIAHCDVPPVVLLKLMKQRLEAAQDTNPSSVKHADVPGAIRLEMTQSEGLGVGRRLKNPWLYLIASPVHQMDHLRTRENSALTVHLQDTYHLPLEIEPTQEFMSSSMAASAGPQLTGKIMKLDESKVPLRPLSSGRDMESERLCRLVDEANETAQKRYKIHKRFLQFVLVFVPFVYCPVQVVLSICYEEFKMLTVIEAHNGYASRNQTKELEILHDCHMHADAVSQWLASCREKEHRVFLVDRIIPLNYTSACRPSREAVGATCSAVPTGAEQPSFFGIQDCPVWTCSVDGQIDSMQFALALTTFLLATTLCCHATRVSRNELLNSYFPEECDTPGVPQPRIETRTLMNSAA
eukprot:TRINITY_DN122508_c0_g1_i1.p1 TRINITY_DN122508_c0_g1~~TRINITY_DN122508_c0_g1_i1.p1  ORF type:complete len:545 (+),score=63.49 TRINITY_DN122508_c0_g1_i1:74-1708(+)